MARSGSTRVPEVRIRRCNGGEPRLDGGFVLYWMIAFRRLRCNFALERAVEWACRLGKPLLVLEPLRCGYRWASARHHRFALDGMAEHAAALAAGPAAYYPYVEPRAGTGRGLLPALAARAAVVVTDDAPVFFLPRMVAAAAARIDAAPAAVPLMEAVDANGLLPLAAADRSFISAYQFRRFLQGALPLHLAQQPDEEPLALLPRQPLRLAGLAGQEILDRWPPATLAQLAGQGADAGFLAGLPIDQAVAPVAGVTGGERAASAALAAFTGRLGGYGAERNDPDCDATSGLSAALHWGHLATHQVLAAVAAAERWSPERLGLGARGARAGWWGMSEGAEAFLDQVVTWRELGYNMAARRPGDHDRFESLPGWAQETLERHRRDPRPAVYDAACLDGAATHDEVWNAAQRQLRREGRIHNYLRMLWGKKVLEWSPSPRDAAALLVELNNRYALDGRDPNSYSGIFWCFGRYDRPWAPERPVFGTVRYMSSDAARRKLHLERYLERHAPGPEEEAVPGRRPTSSGSGQRRLF